MDSKLLLKQPEHFDKLGNPLNVGDYVAYPHNNSLQLGLIIKLNPKMVKLKCVSKKPPKKQRGWIVENTGHNKYPTDCVLVSGESVTLFILKNV